MRAIFRILHDIFLWHLIFEEALPGVRASSFSNNSTNKACILPSTSCLAGLRRQSDAFFYDNIQGK